MEATEAADLVVIGAGVYGLVMAKTFMELHPPSKVIVVDDAATVGGVWAKDRMYTGLKTNNMKGTFELGDFPMDETTFGVKAGEHIPGPVIHEYLTAYAKRFGVFHKIRFCTKVETAEAKGSDGWLLTLSRANENDGQPPNGNAQLRILTRKLVVATGATSQHFMPEFAGSSSFEAPIFHFKDYVLHENILRTAADSVVVFGGAKSAWDACYLSATAGVQAHMVIRKSGHGPAWMAPPYVTPLKKWLEKLVQTRLFTWFSPCAWGDADGYGRVRNFLHGSAVGRVIMKGFWNILGADLTSLVGYDNHPETKKLKPWSHAFWASSSLSILNYPVDFFELVRAGKIRLHIADITRLSSKTVHLSDGTTISASALCCATGWKQHPPITFLPAGSEASLGIPYSAPTPQEEDAFTKEIDEEILTRFPRLKDQPHLDRKFKPIHELDPHSDTVPNRPFRLYRFMVPPAHVADRNIGFTGSILTTFTTVCAQIQALWLCAYFDGELPVSSFHQSSVQHAVERETELHNRSCRWRHPGGAALIPDFVFDLIPYVDLLLGDMGLRKHRKQGRMAEWLEPYGPEDYAGLVDEWKERVQAREDEGERPRGGRGDDDVSKRMSTGVAKKAEGC